MTNVINFTGPKCVGTYEFVCFDCEQHVISYVVAPTGWHEAKPVCAICQFLRTIDDPLEREAMRSHLRT